MTTVLTWMGMLGIPSIFGMIVWCIKMFKGYSTKMNILMKSQQAQMRNTLLYQYDRFMEQGYISNDDLENWENQYQSYHALGQNGILDNRREQLLSLPNRKGN